MSSLSETAAAGTLTGNPVLVLIHGATGNGRMWDPVVRALPRGYRVLTPDMPGHGSRRDERFTLEGAVAAVVDAVRSVAPAPVVVGGDSLGGYVSMASAAALPAAQLRGLVLSGCTTNLTGRALWPFHARNWLNKGLLAVFGEKRLLGERAVKAFAKLGIAEADARAVLAAGVNMGAFGDCVAALRDVDFAAKAAAAQVPIVFVNGSRDRVMMAQQPRFLAAVPSARSVMFEGTEHGVSLRRRDEFAALLDRVAQQVRTSPAISKPV
jgi:pimeloyl-ACP methyl ester carboxylesterase